MINRYFLNGRLKTVFGNKITDIEGWEEALDSDEMYVPHHVLEWKYTSDELKEMGLYDNVPPWMLIWMPRSVHNSNQFLHIGMRIKIENQKGKSVNNQSIDAKRKRGQNNPNLSEFYKKYIDKFNIQPFENKKHYSKEHYWFIKHGKCSWE